MKEFSTLEPTKHGLWHIKVSDGFLSPVTL